MDAGLSRVDWTDAGIRRPKRASRIGNGKIHLAARFRCGFSNTPSITRLFTGVYAHPFAGLSTKTFPPAASGEPAPGTIGSTRWRRCTMPHARGSPGRPVYAALDPLRLPGPHHRMHRDRCAGRPDGPLSTQNPFASAAMLPYTKVSPASARLRTEALARV